MWIKYIDWSYLRGAVILFAGAAILGVSLLTGSVAFGKHMEQQVDHHTARLNDIRNRYLAVDQEEKIIRDYLPRFMELDKIGLSGEEHRLNWVETLQHAGHALGLASLAYEIKAQKPYRPGALMPPGGHQVFVSEMALSMQILHEQDLFALFDLLDEQAQGIYTISSCELVRNFVELTDNPAAGNVTAECLLEWFTVRPGDGQETTT